MPIDKLMANTIIHKVPSREFYKTLKDQDKIAENDLCIVEPTDTTLILRGQFEGSVVLDGSKNVTLAGRLRHCMAKASETITNTNSWFKVASTTTFSTAKWDFRSIVFYVEDTHSSKRHGILRAFADINNKMEVNTPALLWQYASTFINPSNFVLLAIKNNNNITFELWCKMEFSQLTYHFTVLHEAQQDSDKNLWTLYDSINGVESYTTGENVTVYKSTIFNFKNNIDGNASTATALTTSAGSATQPVYFKNGKPVAMDFDLGHLANVSGNATPDLNQNDETAPDYIKNRTHYVNTDGTVVPLDEKFIPDTIARISNSEEWVFTLEDGSTVTKKVVLG